MVVGLSRATQSMHVRCVCVFSSCISFDFCSSCFQFLIISARLGAWYVAAWIKSIKYSWFSRLKYNNNNKVSRRSFPIPGTRIPFSTHEHTNTRLQCGRWLHRYENGCNYEIEFHTKTFWWRGSVKSVSALHISTWYLLMLNATVWSTLAIVVDARMCVFQMSYFSRTLLAKCLQRAFRPFNALCFWWPCSPAPHTHTHTRCIA